MFDRIFRNIGSSHRGAPISLDLSVICSSSLAVEQFLTHFALLECLFIPIFYSLCGDYNWLGTRDHLLLLLVECCVVPLSPLEHSLLLWLVGSIFFLKRLFPLGRSLIVVAKQTDKKYLGRYKNGLSPIQEFIICTLVVTERTIKLTMYVLQNQVKVSVTILRFIHGMDRM